MIRLLLLPLVLLLGACASTAPVRISEHTVLCPPLKVTVTKPSNWQFVSSREERQAQRSVRSTNQTWNYVVYQGAASSFVFMSRSEPTKSGRGASFWISRESLGENRLASSDRAAGMIQWAYQHMFDDARAMGPRVNVTVGGERYSYFRLSHSMSFADGTTYQVERRFWVRSVGLAMVVLEVAFDARDLNEIDPEIRQIIGSIAPAS